MAEDVEPATGGKLRRRATIFMTGAALSALYVWMQPAALGTLEANSAQAAEGTPAGCVLNVAGNRESDADGLHLLVTAVMIDVLRAVHPQCQRFYPIAG